MTRSPDEPVRLTRIYTRGGDAGLTSLGDGSRVSKLDPLVKAYGAVDVRLGHAELSVLARVRHRQIGSKIEQLVLDAFERWTQALREVCAREDDPDVRVQLVDDPVRADARVELRRARAVAEARLTRVAAPRVDLRQPDGLVAVARHVRYERGRSARAGRAPSAR